MKKVLKLIIIWIVLIIGLGQWVYADENLNVNPKSEWSQWNKNSALNNLKDSNFIDSTKYWEEWLYNSIVRVARDLKNIVFIVSTLFFFVIIAKLVFTENTEEESEKFKKWIIWISLWIVVMQTAYAFATVLFDWWVDSDLWKNFVIKIIYPFVDLLLLATSFFFIAMMIYAFFKMVTANWSEDKVKSWRSTIIYAVVWFIVVTFAKKIVEATYWAISCSKWLVIPWGSCSVNADLSGWVEIIVDVINWANTFVAILVIIMIIYSWMNILLSWWDEEKLKKWKHSLIYIAIWILILVINYLILTFFIIPESTI